MRTDCRYRWSRFAVLVLTAWPAGCASVSNPTAYTGVPVRRVPDEVLGRPREEEIPLPINLLRQPPPDVYRLDSGDVLGVLIPDVLGDPTQPPPVRIPQQGEGNVPVGFGYPIPVADDGTISLPFLDPIPVRGLSVPEAQERIRNALLDKQLLNRDKAGITVTLFRQRLYHVQVVRQDAGNLAVSNNGLLANARRGTGIPLDLLAYENDVLTALTRSGGLPGIDARNEIIIQRGTPKDGLKTMPADGLGSPDSLRIPLRLRPGDPIPFKPADIVLNNGDIIYIESRDAEVYYTGGLLPVGEYILPRDYDLDALEAVMQVRGPLANGGINFNNLQGNILSAGLGNPSPSLLTVVRKAPGNRQITIRVDLNRALQDPRERILVQPGDILILQETLGESMTRYVTNVFRFNSFFTLLRQNDANITQSSVTP